MTFGEHVFLYCERGTNAALWAEPINAISNAAFFLAALVAWQLLLWRPREERSADHFLLVGLVFLIGFGSLAFHLYADEGTALADVIPIVIFMLVYLGFALNRFLGVPPGWTVMLAVGFVALVGAAMHVQCWDGGIGLPGPEVTDAKPCLNGSMAYLPALGALIVIGMLLAERHHRAAPYVIWAAVLFTVSIILRSLDMAFCDQVVIDGRNVGTHFIWHLLNTVVLFLLLRASLEAGPVLAAPATAEPVTEAEPEAPSAPAAAPVETVPVEAMPAKDEPVETPEVASAGEAAMLKAAAKAEEEAVPDDGPEPKVSEASDAAEEEAPKEDESEKPAPKSRSKKKPSSPA
jgi:Ceramidase